MYLDTVVKIPDVQGKITCRAKKGTTYVEYEYDREYLPDRKYTIPKWKTIGKRSGVDDTLMYPNENFLKYFPEVELPEERDRSSRSCGLRIGAWIVIRKIISDYGLDETLGRYLSAKDVGLFLDLAAYSIIEEDNRAQYYPVYAYSHPFFAEGMRIYSDTKVRDFLKSMDEEVSVSFWNEWNGKRKTYKESAALTRRWRINLRRSCLTFIPRITKKNGRIKTWQDLKTSAKKN